MTNSKVTDLTAATSLNASDTLYVVQGGADKKVVFSNVIASIPGANIFTKSFDSGNQTITAGGYLGIAHGLGVIPTLVVPYLKCLTAEFSYNVGNLITLQGIQMGDTTNGRGVLVLPDATFLNVRFGSNANPFLILSAADGTKQVATNASWALVIRCWV